MRTAIDQAIEHIVVRAADSERVRSDTASVVERADGTLLVAYHSYSHGPEGGRFWRGKGLSGRVRRRRSPLDE